MSVTANPDFRRLWAALAVSGFGARITRDGLPMMAVIGLAASPGQLGVLAALSTAPALGGAFGAREALLVATLGLILVPLIGVFSRYGRCGKCPRPPRIRELKLPLRGL